MTLNPDYGRHNIYWSALTAGVMGQ